MALFSYTGSQCVIMPISMEQWRASVGLNNAAHSRASMKSLFISPNKILEEILDEFLLSQIGQFSSHPVIAASERSE